MRLWNRLTIWQKALIALAGIAIAIFVFRGMWIAVYQYGLWRLAESFTDELSIYIPLNKNYLRAITFAIFIVIVPIIAISISLNKRRRTTGILLAATAAAIYYAALGYVSSNFKIDPITFAPTKCYVFANGKLKYFDLVDGQERRFDPETGLPCTPVDKEIAGPLARYEQGIYPKRISHDDDRPLFDGAIGTALAWYSRKADGTIELFDNEGFHPETSAKLEPIDPEIAAIWRQQQSKERERKRKEAEAIRIAEEKRRELERQAQLERAKQQQSRLDAGEECDRLAGNEYDRNRNGKFPSVPYQLLAVNADSALRSCQTAAEMNPTQLRYKYQMARALQTRKSEEARAILQSLTERNYPAAFDNLGWIYANERKIRPALELFRRGADLGNAESMVSLAGILSDGKWVQKNEQAAFLLYRNAASLGHPDAENQLAEYEKQQRDRAVGGAIIGTILNGILKK